ncbi:adenosylcobinamide-GDP ribazoletransferase [Litorivivens sp.]
MTTPETSPAFRSNSNEFWLAWTFLTRFPAPVTIDYSPEALNRAARFFPWVGLLLGLFQALVYVLANAVFGHAFFAALCSVAAVVVATGAFHEDGFADYCDSFGGTDTAQRLTIMTDSRLGTFGVAGLVFVLCWRVAALTLLPFTLALLAIVLSAVVSRWLAISLMLSLPYAKTDGKSKPMSNSIDQGALRTAAIPLIPVVFLVNWQTLLMLAVILAVFRVGFSAQLRERLGGFTGDSLGAAQQMAEVLVYGSLLSVGG